LAAIRKILDHLKAWAERGNMIMFHP